MSWTRLNLSPDGGVFATVKKTQVELVIGPTPLRAIAWSEEEPNLSIAIGDGEDAGWVRIVLDEDGLTPSISSQGVMLVLPRSAVPDLQDCRRSPVGWRMMAGALEVRLPTVAAVKAGRPTPRLVSNNPKTVQEEAERVGIEAIAVPDLYTELHKAAWMIGVEITFLSDGNCLLNNKVVSIEEMEKTVSARIKAA